jgi:hypothetical protein
LDAIVLDETHCVKSHTKKVQMRTDRSTAQHPQDSFRISEISKDCFDPQRIDPDQLEEKSV